MGQQWQHRVGESLDAVTFLIPIITPSFFKSADCRAELERFLDREGKLRRGDLILPVYYGPRYRGEARNRPPGESHRWRELRFEPFTSPQVGRMLQKVAMQIVDALERGLSGPLPTRPAMTTAAAERPVDQSAQDIFEALAGSDAQD